MKDLDQQLIVDYLKGDERSLEILISRYLKPIYVFICRRVGDSQEAEDITQEVFVRVWKNIRKFKRQKSFKTWIFSIAKNASIDFLRKKKTVPFSAFENEKGENGFLENLTDNISLPIEIFRNIGLSESISAAFEKISTAYRQVLSLRYNKDLTFREIAQILGEPIDTVKSRHRRGLIQLRKIFLNP